MATVPYVPNTTWADGSGGGTPITAAKLNTVEQGVTDAHAMPSVRVFHTLAQSIPNSTDTMLAFNSERWDSAGGVASTMHDTATNNSRLTCRYAGKYMIIGNVNFALNATGFRWAFVRLNGTTKIASHASTVNSGTASTHVNITTLYDLAVNDYVELGVNQNSGGALSLDVFANYSPEFMWVRVA